MVAIPSQPRLYDMPRLISICFRFRIFGSVYSLRDLFFPSVKDLNKVRSKFPEEGTVNAYEEVALLPESLGQSDHGQSLLAPACHYLGNLVGRMPLTLSWSRSSPVPLGQQ